MKHTLKPKLLVINVQKRSGNLTYLNGLKDGSFKTLYQMYIVYNFHCIFENVHRILVFENIRYWVTTFPQF